MQEGRRNKITSQVGEYLVSVELGRRDFIATTFTGNVPEFDILAIDADLKTIPLQVKTARGGSWQFGDVRKFFDISFTDEDVQRLGEKAKISYPDLIYVFVRLGKEYGGDEFYLIRKKKLQDLLYRKYKKKIIEARRGIRAKNRKSCHIAIWPKDLRKYQDNWGILRQS